MSKKLLIVEDDKAIREAMVDIFVRRGVDVRVAEDGEEALAKIKEEIPDVIVLDILLPKMLGLDVLERLKEDEKTKFVPVVIVTNFGGDENRKRANELGADEFVPKTSMTVDQIVELVSKYFN